MKVDSLVFRASLMIRRQISVATLKSQATRFCQTQQAQAVLAGDFLSFQNVWPLHWSSYSHAWNAELRSSLQVLDSCIQGRRELLLWARFTAAVFSPIELLRATRTCSATLGVSPTAQSRTRAMKKLWTRSVPYSLLLRIQP